MIIQIFKMFHLFGVILLLLSLGANFAIAINGGDKHYRWRKIFSAFHGIALLILIVTGLHLLGTLHKDFPAWIWVKLIAWVFFGGVVAVAFKKPQLSHYLFLFSTSLLFFIVYLVRFQPF